MQESIVCKMPMTDGLVIEMVFQGGRGASDNQNLCERPLAPHRLCRSPQAEGTEHVTQDSECDSLFEAQLEQFADTEHYCLADICWFEKLFRVGSRAPGRFNQENITFLG